MLAAAPLAATREGADKFQPSESQPVAEKAVISCKQLPPTHVCKDASAGIRDLEEAQRACASWPGQLPVPRQKDPPPALARRAAGALCAEAPVRGLRAVRDAPQGDLVRGVPPEHERQHWAIPRVFQQELVVVAGWARGRRPAACRAAFRTGAGIGHGAVVAALRQGPVEHAQHRGQDLVREGGAGQEPRHGSGRGLAHGLPSCCDPEHAFAPGHQEPDQARRRRSPGPAGEAVVVPAVGSARPDHLVPVVLEWPQEQNARINGYAAVPCEEGVHEGVLLQLRGQVRPEAGQLQLVDVLVDFVAVEEPVVKGPPVPADALNAELDVGRQGAPLRGRAGVGLVPVRPDRLLLDMPVPRRRHPAEPAKGRQVPQPGMRVG
eukprot:CAMPEP_0179027170 /NCGR_PEP_ID=MMETSP0796-20121207/8901_1 /TAXON_ID=73915 /ORGANISM="Pyrodinium bahamense, Strain pbaha01" /LENGTH=377 /DNA_ID=CAMNT_0020723291 /DNA_START=1 /DNA_END=1131 /DNA_ORIENTATION=-